MGDHQEQETYMRGDDYGIAKKRKIDDLDPRVPRSRERNTVAGPSRAPRSRERNAVAGPSDVSRSRDYLERRYDFEMAPSAKSKGKEVDRGTAPVTPGRTKVEVVIQVPIRTPLTAQRAQSYPKKAAAAIAASTPGAAEHEDEEIPVKKAVPKPHPIKKANASSAPAKSSVDASSAPNMESAPVAPSTASVRSESVLGAAGTMAEGIQRGDSVQPVQATTRRHAEEAAQEQPSIHAVPDTAVQGAQHGDPGQPARVQRHTEDAAEAPGIHEVTRRSESAAPAHQLQSAVPQSNAYHHDYPHLYQLPLYMTRS
ncbi:hypothetical protein Hypma_006941 [Hypsizygus marmoreus]|uniref:Uncharacterized protein n=1 Tax=Hypsizygus marmoreus TaxID=39966 RepID=A0A369JUY1_HYPMA|nr:hypothetical protein Hypma_006941 [Hypsizygus marmoreus]